MAKECASCNQKSFQVILIILYMKMFLSMFFLLSFDF